MVSSSRDSTALCISMAIDDCSGVRTEKEEDIHVHADSDIHVHVLVEKCSMSSVVFIQILVN